MSTPSFFGLALPGVAAPAASTTRPATPAEILAVDAMEVVPLTEQARSIAEEAKLDDYGVFRLAVHLLDSLPITFATAFGRADTLSAALARGAWGPVSRALAIAALLRGLGYAVMPLQRSRLEVVLGLPLADDADLFDVARIRVTMPDTGVAWTWALWDGAAAVGVGPAQSGTPLLSSTDLASGPQGRFAFSNRALPGFLLESVEPGELRVPGGEPLPYRLPRDAATYLEWFPSLRFSAQARLARQELLALGLDPPLSAFATARATDADRLTALLRTVQTQFRYRQGPLRSLFGILRDRTGDCDQLSLLVAAALPSLGFGENDVRAVVFDGHLLLAIRGRDASAPPGPAWDDDGARFHPLDATYYVRQGAEIASAWGDLAAERVGLPARLERLAF